MDAQTSPDTLTYLRRQPRRRTCEQAAGRLLYLPHTGATVVAYERLGSGWQCVTVGGPQPGRRFSAHDVELETALDVTTVDPLTDVAPALFVAVWHARVWQGWRGGFSLQVADALTRDLQPSRTVELHPEAIRRLAIRAHVRTPGLRIVLGDLAKQGLLTLIEPGGGDHWGTYTLTLPSTDSRDQP